MHKTAFILAALPVFCIGMRAQTVSVADFGLKPYTRENAVPYVRQALEHCKINGISTLTFPKGRYERQRIPGLRTVEYKRNTTAVPNRLLDH